MAYGFQIFNAAGQLIVDTDTSTGLIIGNVLIGAGNQTGSITNDDLLKGTPFVIFFPTYGTPTVNPGISFSGNTMSWNAAPSGFTGRVWYGVK